MIKRVGQLDLDVEKYNNCFETSAQRVYSASHQVVKTLAKDNWEVLVFGDYDAVMPISFKIKFGIKVVVNPPMCQQLGVFSRKDSRVINDLFLNYLKKHYLVRYYSFNSKNQFTQTLPRRKNYVLERNAYSAIFNSYTGNKRWELRQHARTTKYTETRVLTFAECRQFLKTYIKSAPREPEKSRHLSLFQDLETAGLLTFKGFFCRKELVNLVAILDDERTRVLLGAFNNRAFNRYNGASVLIDNQIKSCISQKIFDFEGSEIPSVEAFFRKFNPTLHCYPYIANNRKAIIKEVVQKLFIKSL